MEKRIHEINSWRMFCRVVESGNLTRAAIDLNVDPAFLSRSLKELESELGISLLNRRRRPLVPSAIGEDYYKRIVSIVDQFDAFSSSLPRRSNQISPERTIRISAYQGYGHQCLPQLLSEYMHQNPNIAFTVLVEKDVQDLLNNEFDVFVTACVFEHKDILRFDTRRLPCVLACSPGYLKEHGTPYSPHQLQNHIGLIRNGENFPISQCRAFKGKEQISLKFGRTIQSENSMLLRDSAAAGLGIVMDLPAEFMMEQFERGELVQVLAGWHRAPFHRSVLVSKQKFENDPALAKFVRWITRRETEESAKREMRAFVALGQTPSDYC